MPLLVAVGYLAVGTVGLRVIGGIGWPDLLTLATTGRAWGRGVGVGYARAGIAVQVGDVLTGATTDAECPGDALRGRVVTALWLAGQAGRDVRDYLASDDVAADALTGSQFAATPPVVGSLEERHAAAALLDADDDHVRGYVHANWDRLTREPCASAAELLERFTR
ncbi:MAG: hypothetical protein KY469_08565 [Actinobacteria bacterium]|nr:hypothetical protein [Actinomycetota bacterium]